MWRSLARSQGPGQDFISHQQAEKFTGGAGKNALQTTNLPHHKLKYLPCPECHQLMHRRNFAKESNIIVDECTAHGIWFDKSELAASIHFVRSSPEIVTHNPLAASESGLGKETSNVESTQAANDLTGADLEIIVKRLIDTIS